MRKSGLQKQIASIFNDVPMPQTDPKSLRLPVQQPESDINPESSQDVQSSQQDAVDQAQTIQPVASAQAESVNTPVVSALRPKPLPKIKTVRPKQKTSQLVAAQIKKVLYGSSKKHMDPRQKKMTVLVGVLSVVFATVLIVSLGGVGQKKTKSPAAATEPALTSPGESQTLQQWQVPQPLPAQLRDPMNPQVHQESTGAGGPMMVKGIVFSKENPSAIVGGKIVRQGQTVNGVTVVSISKDSVEFEKNGQRWTQQVQR